MIIFMLIIFALLAGYALYKGYSLREIAKMALPGVKDCLIVIVVLMLIGCLTGLWRASGTVAYFITAGISIMPPSMFILFAFLLTSAMSFAIGTSFGVAATAGVILMSIARAGGVNPVPVAGAIMSGLYVGDRGSPAASSAALVAALTGTTQSRNIRMMLRTGIVPFLICIILYAAMSFSFPLNASDSSVTDSLRSAFTLKRLCILPAILMIVLPFLKVPVKLSMLVDIVISFLLTVFIQKASVLSALKAMILGYTPDNPELAAMLSGGGMISMLNVCVILIISGTFGGILRETGLLAGIDARLSKYRGKKVRFPIMCLLSLACCAVLCNQTIGAIIVNQLSGGLYGDGEEEKYARMIDIEDSVILLAGLIPWCIACSVPLTTIGVGAVAVPLAFYLWLIPLCRIISLRKS